MSNDTIESMVKNAQFDFRATLPWVVTNGGLGASISYNATTSVRVQLVGRVSDSGTQVLVKNPTANAVFLSFGGSAVEATINHYRVDAYLEEVITIPVDATHAACISEVGEGRIMIYRGYGK